MTRKERDAIDEEDEVEEGLYVVEKILDKRWNERSQSYEYLLKWKNWEDKYNSWEPKECLVGSRDLLKDFEKDFAQKLKAEEAKQKENKRKMKTSKKENGEGNPAKKTKGAAKAEQFEQRFYQLQGGIETGKPYEKIISDYIAFSKEVGYANPEQIINVNGAIRDKKKKLHLLVRWKNKHHPTLVPSHIVNKARPDLVIEYYESRLEFRDEE
eukprot:Nk52_evm57s151 gene=Nk52_evmTU57s151